MKAVFSKIVVAAAAAATLGGCSSYGNERPKFAYFIVPCSTPGAIPAQAVSTADDAAVAKPQELLPNIPKAPASADAPQKIEATCLVAAANTRPWTSAYAGYGYPPYFTYPYRRSGGIGAVFHGGGHRGGHRGSHHGGGGHRRH